MWLRVYFNNHSGSTILVVIYIDAYFSRGWGGGGGEGIKRYGCSFRATFFRLLGIYILAVPKLYQAKIHPAVLGAARAGWPSGQQW